jgi:hypothetical protein
MNLILYVGPGLISELSKWCITGVSGSDTPSVQWSKQGLSGVHLVFLVLMTFVLK